MSKKIVIGVLAVFVVLVAAGVWAGLWLVSLSRPANPAGPSPYTAVYMTTGDVYFGKFSSFPKPRMTDVWFLQRSAGQDNQPQYGIVPFGNAFWGPVNEVNLNANQILFWASLRNDSQVVKVLQNPSSAQQNGLIPTAAGVQAPQGGGFKGPSEQPPSQNSK